MAKDGEEFLDVGTEPLLGCMASALIGELPLTGGEVGSLGDGVGGVVKLLQIVRFAVGDDFGQAVGRHQDGEVVALCGGASFKGLGDAIREGVDEGVEGVPCPGYLHRQVGRDGIPRFIQSAVITAHDVRGVLGGEDDSDDLGYAFGYQLAQSFFDERGSVAHADGDVEGGVRGFPPSRE